MSAEDTTEINGPTCRGRMDKSERIGYTYLLSRGFQSIVYEPDGNVAPDFLVDGRIAIEVRRLNQNERDLTVPKGLEQIEIPLIRRLTDLLASYGSAMTGRWFVVFRFRRPTPKWRDLEQRLRSFLDTVRGDPNTPQTRIAFDDNVEIEVHPRSIGEGNIFELVITSDQDSGGWLTSLLAYNLGLCIQEKWAKIRSIRGRYPEWWLLLIDTISYGAISANELATLRSLVNTSDDWDKVILVSPADVMHYYEI
jgi:hypothetical protein